jgi:GT2 family glycosyltransferase
VFHYKKPEGVSSSYQGRPLLSTPEGGLVTVDPLILSVWEYADRHSLEDILEYFENQEQSPEVVRAVLACLASSGLLVRSNWSPPHKSLKERIGNLVSVVLVAYNSREWLQSCLPSLEAQTYSPLEIVLVDNASNDDGAQWVAENYSQVRILTLEKAQPFARAINQGVITAQGDYLLLLNPDVYLESDAIAQLVDVAEDDPLCAAVGAKLKFWWAPAFLNGLGNRVGPFSWGTDNALGYLDLGQFDSWKWLPSVCFAAALISRSAWDQVGSVDEAFPMYYEDSEWSYRARLLGFQIRAAPQSVVYHAFGGRIPSGQESSLKPQKLRNVVHGRLRFAIKLTDKYITRFIRNYLIEDWTNFTRLIMQMKWALARAYILGWLDLIKSLPSLIRIRRDLQERRRVADQDLFALQRDMPPTLVWHGLPELTWDSILTTYLPLIRSGRTRPMPEFYTLGRRPHLLIVSHDVIDVKLAGPGMRYLEMAQALGEDLDVTLAVPNDTTLEVPDLRLVRYWEDRPDSLKVLVENCDVVLVSGYMVEKFPFLEYTNARLVVDLYDPFVLENLYYYLNEPMESQEDLNQHAIDITNRLAKIGDFFICGNERQRDYWLGVLTANGRTNPRNFRKDATLNSLIDIVGIGFPGREPIHYPIMRGIHACIPRDARIVLWGGGVWNWLDPLTLIKAWPEVIERHPKARLVFLGTRHPNPLVPKHEMAQKAEQMAEEVGEKDSSILFFEWLSYQDREALLCESDVGVTLHPIHVETRFSMRTRVLDYLWARLPVLITEGDVTSEWIREYGLGDVVLPFDHQAVAQGLKRILDKTKDDWAPSFEPLQQRLRWSEAVKPLKHYCLEGEYAPDRLERIDPVEAMEGPGLRKRLARARHIWRTEGSRVLLHRIWRYLQWRLARA